MKKQDKTETLDYNLDSSQISKESTRLVFLEKTKQTLVFNKTTRTLCNEEVTGRLPQGFVEQTLDMLLKMFGEYNILDASMNSQWNNFILTAQRPDNSKCVIKTQIMPTYISDLNKKKRILQFLQEADITDALNRFLHGKGVVKVDSCGIRKPKNYGFEKQVEQRRLPEKVPYFITDYIGGGTLEKLTELDTPLKKVIRTFRKTAEPISFIHHNYHIVHSDAKMDNILLDLDGEPTWIDFGSVQPMGTNDRFSESGTLPYISPTQAKGLLKSFGEQFPVHTPRTDIYVLGGLLLGDILFWDHRDNPVQNMHSKCYDSQEFLENMAEDPEIEFPSTKNLKIDDIIHRSLSNKPKEQYKSMQEVIIDLEFVENNL